MTDIAEALRIANIVSLLAMVYMSFKFWVVRARLRKLMQAYYDRLKKLEAEVELDKMFGTGYDVHRLRQKVSELERRINHD